MKELIIDNKKFYYIDKYECKYGEFYKFANLSEIIYMIKENEEFVKITDKKYLREIEKIMKKFEIRDVK